MLVVLFLILCIDLKVSCFSLSENYLARSCCIWGYNDETIRSFEHQWTIFHQGERGIDQTALQCVYYYFGICLPYHVHSKSKLSGCPQKCFLFLWEIVTNWAIYLFTRCTCFVFTCLINQKWRCWINPWYCITKFFCNSLTSTIIVNKAKL